MVNANAKHTYAALFGPGVHWSTDRAWEILDDLPPGVLLPEQRNVMAARIAAALLRAAEQGEPRPARQQPRSRRRASAR